MNELELHQNRLLIASVRLQIRRAARGLPIRFGRQHMLAIDRATSLARTLVEMLKEG